MLEKAFITIVIGTAFLGAVQFLYQSDYFVAATLLVTVGGFALVGAFFGVDDKLLAASEERTRAQRG